MACSAVTLSIATITAVLALACLSISFGTDNWLETRVNRTAIRQTLQKDTDEYRSYETRMEYFSRDTGLFRICFPEKKPKGLETFMSPVQTDCVNVNYYIPENEESDGFSEQRWERLHMARSVVALFIISFFFAFLSFFTGIAGCWKRSNSNIIATGLLQILAALTVAGAMGLWHGVEYYDFKKLHDSQSVYSWPAILRRKGVTDFAYGWSYMLAWAGVGTSLLTGILFLASARCLRREKKADQAKNMQYLMPVYPDKRQPYGYAAYPGPYAYHHGSQYGPYGY
ncbi:transmembrane protein 114 [Dermacentor silvarum]|uniref:transmembrane protein 114 n=1 Tax=Dermacentor silvarum TaxID=543639 RepID=UPI0018979D09|nr:transmembrane protein 114 [Dermacentor silvarum]